MSVVVAEHIMGMLLGFSQGLFFHSTESNRDRTESTKRAPQNKVHKFEGWKSTAALSQSVYTGNSVMPINEMRQR